MQDYLRQLKSIYEEDPWIDESFAKKLKELSEEEAFRQPIPGVHSVAEVLSHLIEWRKELIYRFESGEAPRMFDHSENNWYGNEELSKKGWDNLKQQFEDSQHQLIKLWSGKEDSFLSTKYQEDYTDLYLVEGIVHHDLYHLGQIGLIIKMIGMGDAEVGIG